LDFFKFVGIGTLLSGSGDRLLRFTVLETHYYTQFREPSIGDEQMGGGEIVSFDKTIGVVFT
jgi:hypothetical protein